MNNTNREKILLISAAIAVLVLFGDKFVMSPLLASWDKRALTIDDLEKKVVKGRALMERESAIRRKWMQMLQAGIPRAKSVSENQVLESVDRWARDSRISFTAIKPNWRTTDKGHLMLECRANGYGGLEEIVRFIHALESDSLALKVDTLELTQRDEKGASIGMNVNFSGLLLPEALR